MTSNTEYSELTCIRYNQAITSIKRLYEDKFKIQFRYPEDLREHSDEIMDILSKNYQQVTLINFISAILWSVSLLDKSKYSNEYICDISSIYKEYGKTIKESIERSKLGKEFELSEKEAKSFMIWEDVLKFRNELLNNLVRDNYNSFIELVIVSLYTLHPPVRADYANMRVFIDDSLIPENYKENYCVLQTNPRFVFNKYKNSKHRGSTVVNITPELHELLIDWMEINKSDYLLASYIQSKKIYKPFTEGCLCRRITLIFSKYTNIPVTINTLRHSFVSFMAKNEIKTYSMRVENAEKMMHSLPTADQYRRMVYIN